MGCCLVAMFGAVWPRIILIVLYFFSTIPHTVFQTTLYPLLGFFLLPTTTLAYELAKWYGHGNIDGLWLAVLVLGVLHDIGYTGGLFRRRRSA